MKKSLVIVGGPTASGKTQLAIDLALHFKTVIVSADSRQFYKELTIGTAKPSAKDLQTVHHYFINSHSVTETVSAGEFGIEATELIRKLFTTHDAVVMAGGSGLFIDAVVNGIDDLPKANPETRLYLEKLLAESGISALQKMLQEIDTESYSSIDIQNPRRIIRAIEVTLAAGKPYSQLKGLRKPSDDWNIIMIGFDWPRPELYDRINQRVHLMIENGLKQEAKSVYENRNQNSLRTVGYKEMFMHLEGKISLEETIELIAKNTRNYAKRQLTWFRKYKEMIWIKPAEVGNVVRVVEDAVGSGR